MRYAPHIAVALIGWVLALVGVATADAGAAFGGVAVTTLAIVIGFVKIERRAGSDSPTVAPKAPGAGRHRHAAT